MKKISIVHDFTEILFEKKLDLVLLEISTGYYAEQINELNSYIHKGKLAHYENHKLKLPSFSPSGILRRLENNLIVQEYSHYILLSTDRLTPTEMFLAFNVASRDLHTLACFKSPSGKTLKIIVEVNAAYAYYQECFLGVKEYYQRLLSLPIVNSHRDIPNLCFYSHDPDLYQATGHTIFQIEIPNY